MVRPLAAPSLAVGRLALQPGETVIDVACGTGLTSRSSNRRLALVARIVGVDLSGEMLSQARERAAASGWQNITLIEAAVEEADIEAIADAALFSFTHDVLQSPPAVANVVRAGREGEPARTQRAGSGQTIRLWPDTIRG